MNDLTGQPTPLRQLHQGKKRCTRKRANQEQYKNETRPDLTTEYSVTTG
jgi:hypothetical protein